MSICPRCGNHTRSGVCYTCVRNQRDYKRYGRRRPAQRKRQNKRSSSTPISMGKCAICGKAIKTDLLEYHVLNMHSQGPDATTKKYQRPRTAWKNKEKTRPKTKSTRSPYEECSICGQDIRSDHLKSHMRFAHQQSPSATKDGRQQARITWKKKETAKPKTKNSQRYARTENSQPYFKKCPICGDDVRWDLVEDHRRRYHYQAGQKAIETNASSTQTRRERTKRRTYRKAKSKQTKVKKQYPSETNSKHSRKGINRLLEDIFDEPTFLSQILQKNGVYQQRINLLHQERLDVFLSHLIQSWVAWWQTILSTASVGALIKQYDLIHYLGDKASADLSTHNLSLTRTNYYRTIALAHLRTQKNKRRLEQIVFREAKAVVGKLAKE